MTEPRQGRHLRVAVLQPSISIVLERLGRLDAIVACTKYCLEAVPALRSRQVEIIADSWSARTEQILSNHPDLVLASVPYRLESLAAILKSGCPVLTLAPHCLADIYQDIHLLASLLDANEQACALVREMRGTIAEIGRRASHAGARPRVYCEEWGKPMIHSQSWVGELVSVAGGNCIGTPGATTDAGTVHQADPDVLIFAWCGAGNRVPLSRVVEQRGWQELRAVKSGCVYCIPDELLNTPATNLVQGAQAMAACIHPEIFGVDPAVRALKSCVEEDA